MAYIFKISALLTHWIFNFYFLGLFFVSLKFSSTVSDRHDSQNNFPCGAHVIATDWKWSIPSCRRRLSSHRRQPCCTNRTVYSCDVISYSMRSLSIRFISLSNNFDFLLAGQVFDQLFRFKWPHWLQLHMLCSLPGEYYPNIYYISSSGLGASAAWDRKNRFFLYFDHKEFNWKCVWFGGGCSPGN